VNCPKCQKPAIETTKLDDGYRSFLCGTTCELVGGYPLDVPGCRHTWTKPFGNVDQPVKSLSEMTWQEIATVDAFILATLAEAIMDQLDKDMGQDAE